MMSFFRKVILCEDLFVGYGHFEAIFIIDKLNSLVDIRQKLTIGFNCKICTDH